MVSNRVPFQAMKTSLKLHEEADIDQAIARWNTEKDYRVFPTAISYSVKSGLTTLTFENGACYQFNPLHVQEVTLEVKEPTIEQLSDVVIRAGGGSLHWPQLDASIGVDNLLLGRYGTDKWMAQLKTAL